MKKRSTLVWPAALLSVSILSFLLYAGDKKPAPRSFKIYGNHHKVDRMTQLKGELLAKLNHSPEYKNLAAKEKVRIIVRELRRARNLSGRTSRISKRDLHSTRDKSSPELRLEER